MDWNINFLFWWIIKHDSDTDTHILSPYTLPDMTIIPDHAID